MATTANDIVTGSLLNIGAYSLGDPADNNIANLGLNLLNDLLDSLSNDEAFVYTQQETLFNWISGQYQYTVGNPVGGTFTGTITGGSPTITEVTVPSQLIVGGTLTSLGGVIPTGTNLFPQATTIIAIGTNTVTMSQNATATPAINPDTITYTVPGNIPMNRPLRFQNGFTRAPGASNLDYQFKFVDFDAYKRELLKSVPGPWPYIASYQPTFPYGQAYFYPAPSAGYTAHIFSDLILSEFATLTAPYSLPQGYTRALKKLLALELAPILLKTPSPELIRSAKEAKDLIKGTNSTPVKVLQYDSAIAQAQTNDAGWILRGGFF
jgi:hypothetical protein